MGDVPLVFVARDKLEPPNASRNIYKKFEALTLNRWRCARWPLPAGCERTGAQTCRSPREVSRPYLTPLVLRAIVSSRAEKFEVGCVCGWCWADVFVSDRALDGMERMYHAKFDAPTSSRWRCARRRVSAVGGPTGAQTCQPLRKVSKAYLASLVLRAIASSRAEGKSEDATRSLKWDAYAVGVGHGDLCLTEPWQDILRDVGRAPDLSMVLCDLRTPTTDSGERLGPRPLLPS
ncbi:hypothetical protein EXIGLDRAFT_781752 [Exidia glandulosa HHB12029]|uniref:Uncharacterized protein n=1 Tax=Exidia glandulosa HHB12029 TaxID=1314781 RepID=A0A165B588_EXIGL|nr:hypothetical protein EXIGLDRAFT_781752 [Exidia glandulosa HHB12029]